MMISPFPSQLGFWIAGLSGAAGTRLLYLELSPQLPELGIARHRRQVERVSQQLRELEELLLAGIVPGVEKWEKLQDLPHPWGSMAFECVRELRACGGALLPTLGRLRALADSQGRALTEARAKSAQAMVQALCCGALAPLFGLALYFLLPGIAESARSWLMACAGAVACSLAGALWLLAMMERARWAGLPSARRSWIFASQCAGERFLALVRGGNPADIAWGRACELLGLEAPGLALVWGHSIWKEGLADGELGLPRLAPGTAARGIQDAGDALRKAVQLSLMEGRPCLERVEAALESLRHELRALVDRELSLLSTRALRPLFLLVAPSILGLLAFGIFLSWQSMGGGLF